MTPLRPRPRRGAPFVIGVALLALAACGTAERTAPAPTARPDTEAPASPAASPTGSALLTQLRRGGFVIFFRHAATDPATDTDLQNLENCAAQRNISERGRAQAREIGRAFRELSIPVGPVLSSGLCRTRETAMLAFNRLEVSVELTSLPQAGSEEEEARRVSALRGMLATAPPNGRNTVLVSHLFNIQRAADISMAEGDAVVVQPREGTFTVVATVPPDGWRTLGG